MAIQVILSSSREIQFPEYTENSLTYFLKLKTTGVSKKPDGSAEYINPKFYPLVVTVRDYFIDIIDPDGLVTFQDGTTRKKYNDKNGDEDNLDTQLIVKNPKKIGWKKNFQLKIHIEPDNSKVIYWEHIEDLTITTTFLTIDTLQYKASSVPNFISHTSVNNPFLDSQISITGTDISKYFQGGYYQALCTISEDDNKVTFNNGQKSIAVPISISSPAVKGSDFNSLLNLRSINPGVFGYSKEFTINYKLQVKLNPSDIFTTFAESDTSVTLRTDFQTQPTINYGIDYKSPKLVNFKTVTEADKQYTASFSIRNLQSLTDSQILEIRVDNDTDNIIEFNETGSKIIELDKSKVSEITNVGMAISNPKIFNYQKSIKLVFSLFDISSGKSLVFSETIQISITLVNANINNNLNVILNNNTNIAFSYLHEFRRSVSFNFSVDGLSSLNPLGTYKFKLEVLDDFDNVFGVFDDDTKTIIKEIGSSITVDTTITNPTQLQYAKSVNFRVSILELSEGSSFSIFSTLIPVAVTTTYRGIKRSIFIGEQDVTIANLNLEQKTIKSTLENEVYFNVDTFQPTLKLSEDDSIFFDLWETKTKNFNLVVSITGLNVGNVEVSLLESNEHVFLENGLKDIEYEIDVTNQVSDVIVPIVVTNPYQIGYDKTFQLRCVVTDTIDYYTKIFNIRLFTTYTIDNYTKFFVDTMSGITKDLKNTLSSLNESVTSSLESIKLIDTASLNKLNDSIVNFDSESLVNNLNIGQQIKSLEKSILESNASIETILQNVESLGVTKARISFTDVDGNETMVEDYAIRKGFMDLKLPQSIGKGIYILKIEQMSNPILTLNVVSSQSLSNYQILQVLEEIPNDFSNFKLKTSEGFFNILTNNKKEILVFSDTPIADDSKVEIHENVFDTEFMSVEINKYNIDDVGAVFLNKKVTDLKTKKEIILNDDGTTMFTLDYKTENGIETRNG